MTLVKLIEHYYPGIEITVAQQAPDEHAFGAVPELRSGARHLLETHAVTDSRANFLTEFCGDSSRCQTRRNAPRLENADWPKLRLKQCRRHPCCLAGARFRFEQSDGMRCNSAHDLGQKWIDGERASWHFPRSIFIMRD